MRLVIGSWFSEPEISFKISHKVINLIRETIIEDILKPKEIYNENDDDFVGIQITTNKILKEAYLDTPIFDKKNNLTNYNFWLPYLKIKKSRNEKDAFVKYFFIVLEDFLKIYNISNKDVINLKTKIEYLITDNDDYEYEEEDINIDDILKDLDL